jgi:hypothetical protein
MSEKQIYKENSWRARYQFPPLVVDPFGKIVEGEWQRSNGSLIARLTHEQSENIRIKVERSEKMELFIQEKRDRGEGWDIPGAFPREYFNNKRHSKHH